MQRDREGHNRSSEPALRKFALVLSSDPAYLAASASAYGRVSKSYSKGYMTKQDVISACGEVVEAFPSALFRIRLENNLTVIGYLSGRLRQNNIKIVVGDWVDVEMSPYDLSRARIIYRHRSRSVPTR